MAFKEKTKESVDLEKEIKFKSPISENIDNFRKANFSKILYLGIVNFCLNSDEPIDFSFIIPKGIENIAVIRIKHLHTNDNFFFVAKKDKKIEIKFIRKISKTDELCYNAEIIDFEDTLLITYAYASSYDPFKIDSVQDKIKLED
ncbi:MAG: hypothetical protein QXF07_00915 [Candidatus Micrarchaeia archaeon]